MGELHLDIKVDPAREFKVEVNVGAPQVAYRETITKSTEIDYTHKKQSGGSGQFARVKFIEIEPTTSRAKAWSSKQDRWRRVPKEYMPGVEKGMNSVMSPAPLIGFPMVDVKVTLIDGAYHEVDSSVLAFEIASRAAFREGHPEGGA
jgi:elongation factor G